jgi:hypothetical protein
VDRGRLPFAGRLRQPAGQSRFWTAVLDRALTHPAPPTTKQPPVSAMGP